MSRVIASRLNTITAILSVVTACTLLLTACGGGGGGSSTPAAATAPTSGGTGGGGGGTPTNASGSTTCFSGTGPAAVNGVTPPADTSQPWPPAPCAPPVACAGPLTGTHATYNVGQGQTYPNLTNVPWLSLVAGDVVNIYPGTYSTVVALRAQGTLAAPVIINGVTDTNCTRPVITGKNANTAADALKDGFFTGSGGSLIQGQGLFVVWRNDAGSSPDPFGYKPSFIAIQNLTIEGANGGNTYTGTTGSPVSWPADAAGIDIVVASVFTIQNCQIIDNGQGVSVNSKNDDADTSYYITLRGNSIYNDGVVGSDQQHNIYIDGVRSLYEGNYVGQVISGSNGGSLKDRSSAPVVRYNYIVSSARALDLVDTEGGSPTVIGDPLYNYGWVYGNVIVNGANGSGDLIHWGGDSTQYGNYHNNALSVYFNTIVNTINTSVFDMATNQQIVNAHSNIITGTSNLSLCTNSASNGTVGFLNLDDRNWIESGFGTQSACTLSQPGSLLANSPVLTATYGLPAGSPAVNAGTTFPTVATPAGISVANLTPTEQVSIPSINNPTYVARTTVTDIGAFAGP